MHFEAFLIPILKCHKTKNPAGLHPKSEKLTHFTRLLERQYMELVNFRKA
jgi:hypothetical protein